MSSILPIENTEALQRAFANSRAAARADALPTAATRLDRLARLERLLREHLPEWETAIAADFGERSRHETRLEAYSCLSALRHTRRHLKAWMRPQRRSAGLAFFPGRAEVRVQPLGTVGIVVPWNYPIFLSFGPLVDALAAGNRVLVKISEYTPQTAALFARLAARHFAPEEFTVVGGDVALAEAFSRLPFDHLFFTGSSAVGQRIMQAAAEHLTPVTLELGGKSPLLIAPDYPLAHAAERLIVGKCLNAGQTCVAPDYVLVTEGSEQALIAELQAALARLYPDFANTPDYSSIVNARQYQRLAATLDDARDRGARIVELCPGVPADPARRRMPPLALLDTRPDMRVMQEEIFGPLLPIVTYRQLDQALEFIRAGERPLAFYLFDRDRARTDRVLDAIHAGGVTINDVVLHLAQHDLPFGGIGHSGMGHYHGRDGFMTFSKQTGVFRQSRLSGVALFNPPYNRRFERLLAWLMR